MHHLTFLYAERYLDSDQLPVHYVSDGDYYLVIPRYDSMSLSLYVNDIETSLGTLRFRDSDCGPFVIQCSASDIFADVTMRLEYNGETAEFSPFISLKDGAPVIGERGFDLTKPGTAVPQYRRSAPVKGGSGVPIPASSGPGGQMGKSEIWAAGRYLLSCG